MLRGRGGAPGLTNAAAVSITGGNIDGVTITGLPLGLAGTPTISPTGGPTSGIYWASATNMSVTVSGVEKYRFGSGGLFSGAGGFAAGTTAGSPDAYMERVGANQWRFSTAGVTTTSRTEFNGAYAAIADAAATATMTITIPNAAHSASILVRVTGSLGAGGAIGANEATASNSYIVSLTRTAGVNATAAISAAFGAAATAVAGAATVTCTAAMSAVAGAVGATNTFTVNVTITRSGGSSTNHTCLVYAQLMNANVTGITLS